MVEDLIAVPVYYVPSNELNYTVEVDQVSPTRIQNHPTPIFEFDDEVADWTIPNASDQALITPLYSLLPTSSGSGFVEEVGESLASTKDGETVSAKKTRYNPLGKY